MPDIKYFEIVRDVISLGVESIARQKGITCQEAYLQVVQHLRDNSNEWRANRPPAIPYRDPLCRIAYLYGIVPANANLIEFAFEHEPDLENHLDSIQKRNGQVAICAFGGGPGTELLGVAKRIERRSLDSQIVFDFLLLDRVCEWMDSWQAIRHQIEVRFRLSRGVNRNVWPVQFSGNALPIDITDTSNFGNLGTIFGQDIYILSYVISEIFGNFGDLQSFTANMASHAPAGSKFLFIDRREQRWREEVHNLANVAGITLAGFRETTQNMSTDEDKTDLGQIYLDVGRDPRLTWDAFWVVGTKT